ncbi:MAG: hypothetical protein CSA07_05110 [Bacteroidia bacterium]|nr:MAG: hypothetical protein CSA07_05110 [Bacteroidia bacterium]
MATYINPFTDFGFKRLFGQEENKDLLMSFLNELLRGQQVIERLTYLKTEHLGGTQFDRRAIFDLYCENERGEKFIVELQRARQEFFKDRSVFYSTFPIQEEAQPNDWDFRLRPVYTIAILDFVFDNDTGGPDKYRYDVQLMETELKEVFYRKLTYIYLLMPKFNKKLEELETGFEKWLYALKHLYRLAERPGRLSEAVFEKFFQQAHIAEFTKAERAAYHHCLKAQNDWRNIMNTARADGFREGVQEGIEQGMEQGLQQGMEQGIKRGIEQGIERGMEKGMEKGIEQGMEKVARSMLARGMDAKTVAELTGLSLERVMDLTDQPGLD